MVFTSKTLDAYVSKYGFLGFDQFPNPLFEAHEVYQTESVVPLPLAKMSIPAGGDATGI